MLLHTVDLSVGVGEHQAGLCEGVQVGELNWLEASNTLPFGINNNLGRFEECYLKSSAIINNTFYIFFYIS